jgi:hypothetical protein
MLPMNLSSTVLARLHSDSVAPYATPREHPPLSAASAIAAGAGLAALLARGAASTMTGVGVAIVLGAGGVIWSLFNLGPLRVSTDAVVLVQGVEAILNIVALAGAAIWFLLNLESNMRRDRVLADLHELRSIAHVVDMHQLTKDPTQLLKGYTSTASSDVHHMSELELLRYLDYCSEMLSLTGKLAALYMQDMRDPVIIETVTEIEDLTTSLSRKIWQKIMILQQASRDPAR